MTNEQFNSIKGWLILIVLALTAINIHLVIIISNLVAT